MCGIAGIVTSRGRVTPARVADMIATLDHRGPDDRGLHVEAAVGLASARLSVIDPAGGRQPMANEDGSIRVVFNGEIFNFVELRRELVRHGHRFRTRSDTEVLLRLYEEDGPALTHRLNGQWAFAIWDARAGTLLLSRDRIGVRPLFYTRVRDALLFASEIKALFADPDVCRELEPAGLDNVFTFWTTLPPRTVFKGVSELPPGHTLTWTAGRVAVTPHWQPSFPDAPPQRSEGECAEVLRSLLKDSVRLRLRSDARVGTYLSGGLDSSVIAALTAAGGEPLPTFSITFDDAEFDERVYQREVAQALGTVHHELRCSHADIGQVFPDVIRHAEMPLLRTAPAPLFLLSRFVRDAGYKVVLTGEGADEVLGGYDIFKEAKIRRFWTAFPSSRRRPLLLQRLYPYMRELQRQPAAWLRAFFHVTREDLDSPFFSHLPRWTLTSRLKLFLSDSVRSALTGYDGYAELAARLPAQFDRWDPFCRAQYLEIACLLPGYILSSQGDRVAMAHSVEGRFPFLDPRVVEFASSLSPTVKMKVLEEKHLLKVLARGLVPESVRRRRKQPYRAPEGKALLAAGRGSYVDDLLSSGQLRRDGIFKPAPVERLLAKFRDGRAIGTKDNMALVGIVSTQLLVDQFINNVGKGTHAGPGAGTTQVYRR